MTYALAGQILVCWIVLAFAFAPLIGRWLYNRRINRDFNRELKLVLNREALIAAIKRDIEAAPKSTPAPMVQADSITLSDDYYAAFMCDDPKDAA